jgi:hypothetical protein
MHALKLALGFYIHCHGYPQPSVYKRSTRHTWYARTLKRIQTNMTDATAVCYFKLLHSLRPTCQRRQRRYYSSCHRRSNQLTRLVCGLTVLSATSTEYPTTAQRTRFDTDSKLIYVDSGATASITNDLADCLTTPVPILRRINGIGGTVNAQVYKSTIGWTFEDDDGTKHLFRLPNSFYIPKATNRVMSPQHWAQTAKDNSPRPRGTCARIYDNCLVLRWSHRRFTRTIPLNIKGTNIAELYTAPNYNKFSAFCQSAGLSDDIDADDQPVLAMPAHLIEDEDDFVGDPSPAFDVEEEQSDQYFPTRDSPLQTTFKLDGPTVNLPTVIPDEEDKVKLSDVSLLLRYHHRMGHAPMSKLQEMARQGILPSSLAKCPVPLCTACAYGKATRRPWRVKGRQQHTKTITHPGQCISVDQLISPTPGYIAQLRGIPTKKRYQAATIFVDQYSGAGFVYCQKTTSALETIEAKERFESWAAAQGVSILHYHADNGIFADNQFRKAVTEAKQTLSFCGVNAHFQNGFAERRIRELQGTARTMLIHASRRWPRTIDAHLWPYAIRYASDVFNHSPMKKHHGQTPTERFSGSKVTFNIRHAHTFGCPVYVLDNRLQQEKRINKWTERSRVGIFLGYSPQHARTVSLILSLSSGLTLPQFHTIFDDTFSTIRASFGESPPHSSWQYKAGFAKKILPVDKLKSHTPPSQRETEFIDPEPTTTPESSLQEREPVIEDPDVERPPDDGRRRSARKSVQTERYLQYMEDRQLSFVAYEAIAYLETDPTGNFHPLQYFQASADPDTIYWHEAMAAQDKKQFLDAAKKEVEDHTKNKLWEVVHKRKVPQGALIAPGVWAMKRKRRIATREVYKWKARLAYDGSKQTKNVNYWDTYAPVISWPIVRYLLTLIITQGWAVKQVDFVLAYTQADAETDMYMKPPKGFEFNQGDAGDYVLKIKKNYYGQRQAGRVWNRHLTTKLLEAGFTQSAHDECLFYHGRAIYALYTDDSLLAGPDETELESILLRMKEVGLKITHEDGIEDFLGVKVDRRPDGTIELTQPQLIDSILQDLRLDQNDTTVKKTPSMISLVLGRHLEAEPFDHHFHYRSVVGKLNYLEKSTRPDLAYASHQCARFAQDPRIPHGKALKWIGRYLRATRHKGLTLRPDTTKGFDAYADADFAGNFIKGQAPTDVDTARSRTGFVIFYAGCPIYWRSILQTEIALSTTEAEIIALSTALKTAIPLMEITKEMKSFGYNVLSTVPIVHCKLFEDNSGAIEIATNKKVRPRTRYMNVKWFHFRHYYEQGAISILPCSSEQMTADFLTKPLDLASFERHRRSVNGW